jgi:hypothetical protein
MRSPESTRHHASLNLLTIAGGLSAAAISYASGISEYWANNSQTVGSETWKSLPVGMQQFGLEALKISSACAYGAATGVAIDRVVNNWEWLNKQATKSGLVEKIFKYHPSNYLSVLR